MISCKDCIHEKVCVIKAFPDVFENTEWSKEPCDHFENKSEVAKKICCENEEEICAALDSNYRALKEWDNGRNNDYILEFVGRIKGKIDALRGIEAFVEELKEKYTKGGEGE